MVNLNIDYQHFFIENKICQHAAMLQLIGPASIGQNMFSQNPGVVAFRKKDDHNGLTFFIKINNKHLIREIDQDIVKLAAQLLPNHPDKLEIIYEDGARSKVKSLENLLTQIDNMLDLAVEGEYPHLIMQFDEEGTHINNESLKDMIDRINSDKKRQCQIL